MKQTKVIINCSHIKDGMTHFLYLLSLLDIFGFTFRKYLKKAPHENV